MDAIIQHLNEISGVWAIPVYIAARFGMDKIEEIIETIEIDEILDAKSSLDILKEQIKMALRR